MEKQQFATGEEVVYEDEYGSLIVNEEGGYVGHIIHNPIPTAELTELVDLGSEKLAEYGLHGWYSDDRLNGPLSEETVRYGLEEWGPRTAKAGWKYWAIVVPESMDGRATMQDLVSAYFEMGVRVAVFTDPAKAREWLSTRD